MDDAEFNRRYSQIFTSYNDIISPFVMQFEVLDAEFPIAILNEIRAIMGHLSRIVASTDLSIREDNLIKAERHIKRAIYDCYKYTCISYYDEYNRFCHTYRGIDLSDIKDGEFLRQLTELKRTATNTLKQAKETEINPESTDNIIYEKYEQAYHKYFELYDYIEKNIKFVERAKHKKFKRSFFEILGYVVGILGLTATVIQFFL